uniref:DNA-directed RNA polymerase I subunit D n=1 Tax=Ditylenchus dipsaci TaxID=166011 RepID=A0A915E098_9BILA
MEATSSEAADSETKDLLPPYKGQDPKVEIMEYEIYKQDQSMITIIFREEDHTIGNLLKEVICKMKGVEFCGYNVPHPLEDKILLRIQTYKGYSAGDILLQAFTDLEKIFKSVEEKFEESYKKYRDDKS